MPSENHAKVAVDGIVASIAVFLGDEWASLPIETRDHLRSNWEERVRDAIGRSVIDGLVE